jgi:hypothetical protein
MRGELAYGIAGFYLGERVVVTAFLPDGWCLAKSRKGRLWRHWADQIKTKPWGVVAVGDGGQDA